MLNVRGLKDLHRGNNDEIDMNEYWDKITNKITSSFAMGISFGTGALLSFYILKHFIITKAQ